MPWISAGASIGSAVIGGVMGSRSAKKARQAQEAATNRALGVNQGVYDDVKGIYSQSRDIGGNALSRLSSQADEFRSPLTSEQVMAEPGYQFGLSEGQKGIEGSAAARGGLYSGANLKALQRFGTDYATTKYNDAYNRLRTDRNDSTNRFNSLAQFGQNANNATAGAANQFGQNAIKLINGQGNANANAAIESGNAWTNALNQGVSAIGGINWGASGVGGPKATTGDFTRMDRGQGYADGGEVKERGPESGNMSREAIMAAIKRQADEDRKRKPQPAQEPGKAKMGNYLTDPASVMRKREQDAGLYSGGGHVKGPGGPKDDAIPAMLSNGEHVMDVATVKAVGGGSMKKGHNLLTRMRMGAK